MLPKINLNDYRYTLPKEKIALYPVSPRDRSKLLRCEKGTITHDQFANLADYIPSGSLMVFNQTKVVRARLLFKTATGAQVEIFCLEPASGEEQLSALSSKESVEWKCFVGNAKRWKQEEALTLVLNDDADALHAMHTPMDSQATHLIATLIKQESDHYLIRFNWTPASMTWVEVLDLAGKMPLPPYIKREANTEDEDSYQTVYARVQGSVAAPTAGLHFTDQVLQSLQDKDIKLAYTTLHVGAGTFKPIKTDDIHAHDMHEEELIIEQSFVQELLHYKGKPLVAVGTTSVRCIESLYWVAVKLHAGMHTVSELNVMQWDPYNLSTSLDAYEALEVLLNWMKKEKLQSISIKTAILILPGYSFKYVRRLITNFHQPESTLMLLVAAFVGEKWGEIYQYALENDFRFLSYGDSSLLHKECE